MLTDAVTTGPRPTSFLTTLRRYEILLPLILFLAFFLIAAPGISWGTPANWNPDELVTRVDNALGGDWRYFDEENFDYPSLPKWVMYGLGRVVYGLHGSRADFVIAARLVSVLLGALVVVLAYRMTRLVSGSPFIALLAGLLTLTNSELAVNARFAHNDLYLAFFVSLTVYALLEYCRSRGRLWLYLAFLTVGMAASSKYNGGSLLLVPLLVFLATARLRDRAGLLRTAEELFISLALSFLGYVVGTPKALLWMAFYIKRVSDALLHHAIYGRQPDSVVGLVGQWRVLLGVFGAPLFILALLALLWAAARLALAVWRSRRTPGAVLQGPNAMLAVVFLSCLAFNLPILFSYNYQARFFISLVPLCALLVSLLVAEVWARAVASPQPLLARFAPPLILALLAAGLLFAGLRQISVALLFKNDARIAAGEFIKTLPTGTSIEYTLYPPNIPPDHFAQQHDYPIFFIKYAGHEPPKGGQRYRFNEGEAGIERRQTDYLVIDSFTYRRFSDEYICDLHPEECTFFRRLQAGQANYHLLQTFSYRLPAYLPQLSLSFLNPEIQVYERLPGANSKP